MRVNNTIQSKPKSTTPPILQKKTHTQFHGENVQTQNISYQLEWIPRISLLVMKRKQQQQQQELCGAHGTDGYYESDCFSIHFKLKAD